MSHTLHGAPSVLVDSLEEAFDLRTRYLADLRINPGFAPRIRGLAMHVAHTPSKTPVNVFPNVLATRPQANHPAQSAQGLPNGFGVPERSSQNHSSLQGDSPAGQSLQGQPDMLGPRSIHSHPSSQGVSPAGQMSPGLPNEPEPQRQIHNGSNSQRYFPSGRTPQGLPGPQRTHDTPSSQGASLPGRSLQGLPEPQRTHNYPSSQGYPPPGRSSQGLPEPQRTHKYPSQQGNYQLGRSSQGLQSSSQRTTPADTFMGDASIELAHFSCMGCQVPFMTLPSLKKHLASAYGQAFSQVNENHSKFPTYMCGFSGCHYTYSNQDARDHHHLQCQYKTKGYKHRGGLPGFFCLLDEKCPGFWNSFCTKKDLANHYGMVHKRLDLAEEVAPQKYKRGKDEDDAQSSDGNKRHRHQ